MKTRSSPVAVFDSGVGGISVLKELVALLPNENFRYFGDSANAPYGIKTSEQVRELTMEHIGRMISQGAKAVVIACNTATSAAVGALRDKYPDIPIIGMEPALKTAVLSGCHPRVLVMATPMTLRLEKFNRLMEKYHSYGDIHLLPCKGLVERIEAGDFLGDDMKKFLTELLREYIEAPVDSVVLGCTHYPFVRPLIRKLLGEEVKIIDGSLGTAKELMRRLESIDMLNTASVAGSILFENSRNTENEIELCKKLFAVNIE